MVCCSCVRATSVRDVVLRLLSSSLRAAANSRARGLMVTVVLGSARAWAAALLVCPWELSPAASGTACVRLVRLFKESWLAPAMRMLSVAMVILLETVMR